VKKAERPSTATTRNLKVVIEYDGTNYGGWQRQKNAMTVQQALEEAIERIVQQKVTLTGASRTDAGVHALGQVANFRTASRIPAGRLLLAINSQLPPDVVVKSVAGVDDSFHATFNARSKVYRYTILNRPVRSALDRDFCHFVGPTLDVNAMRRAARFLIGRHDFKAFESDADPESNSVRTVMRASWQRDGHYLVFTIEGDGFLYNMVRAIVGTLTDVGRGKITPQGLKDILESRDRTFAGPTAPAKGLCLVKVKY
jgi:tRNA pseudouridine38-40 synthase